MTRGWWLAPLMCAMLWMLLSLMYEDGSGAKLFAMGVGAALAVGLIAILDEA